MKLSKTYEPNQYEAMIYDLWEQSDAFKPSEKGKGTYSIVAPPPNANASLHIGYGLTIAIEDISVRYNRLRGKSALFVPGSDHAGFETQAVYEKHLAAKGKSRFDYSREELYQQMWDFVAENRAVFDKQFRSLGASFEWSRYTFTLDEKVVKRAYATFKKLWDEKLIYRGERLVNYCTFHRTGFADVEVEFEEVKTPLYYIKYGPFTLATTRPETKFGDTGVAVHPTDKRYKEWVGKTVTVEGVNGPFEVRVVADEMVDPDFGTGVVKITPAHSFDDWEVAQRHNLPPVRVINHDGTMNHHAGRFAGKTVMEARKAVVEAMHQKGLLERIDNEYKTRVGKCYKCGTIIEPMLMEQWFVDMQPLAKPAIKVLKADKIKFYPDSKKDQLINYLEGLRDWNISRQIAWGIPIPAFQNVNDSDDWIFDERVGEEIIEVNGKTYRRDPDVFDTWFSSSSWPYVTLDYPGEDFKKFYPLSLMETGGEILYPWVSRMIMLGLYVTGEIPFEAVYIHGYVMAEDGSKMSKSKGNTVSSSEVVEQYGSDALRMGIISGRSPAVNRGYDRRRVEKARNFCNKLWNVARFVEDTIGDDYHLRLKPKPETEADHWILTKLQRSADKIAEDLDNYRFAEAYETLFHTLWDDFADWYIEASKSRPNHSVLAHSLDTILKLAHPFAPFVTETIWQTLKWEEGLLVTSAWPKVESGDKRAADEFRAVRKLVREIRSISRKLKLNKPLLYHQGSALITKHNGLIAHLGGLKEITEVSAGRGLRLTESGENCWLDVDRQTAEQYLGTLADKQTAEAISVERLRARLANKSYVDNAPKELVEETKQQLSESERRLKQINGEIDSFTTASKAL